MTPQEIGAKANALMKAGHLLREEVLEFRAWTRNPEMTLESTAKLLDDIALAAGYVEPRGEWVRPCIRREQ